MGWGGGPGRGTEEGRDTRLVRSHWLPAGVMDREGSDGDLREEEERAKSCSSSPGPYLRPWNAAICHPSLTTLDVLLMHVSIGLPLCDHYIEIVSS
ncbi:hypothetical protein NL676_027071 [Syzygium grande]|nr:hypothetical protein NL676_027071 [Syzygium grande]